MFLNINQQKKTSVALVDNEENSITYGELAEKMVEVGRKVEPRSIIFILCKNTVGAMIGYLGFIENEAVTGGAISVVNGGNLNVCNSTFINNTATIGQAIASATVVVDENSTGSPTTTIENNEFYRNAKSNF